MKQNAAGVDVSGKWFFDRYSPTTNIKAVGNADVTYGLAIDGDKVTRKELTIEATVTTLCPCSKEIVSIQRTTNVVLSLLKHILIKISIRCSL